jgi:tRNA (guanine-N7-)-methyltransferase
MAGSSGCVRPAGVRGIERAVPQPNPYERAPKLPEGDDLDPRAFFEGAVEHGRSVELEIGPGRGGFAFERLVARPDVCVLGLEVRRKWATIVDDRLRARGFGSRARVFAEDARDALPRLRSGTLSVVFIHFPDPWWKKRHQKRLVASTQLLHEVVRLLQPGGELFFQTDVEERAAGFEALAAPVTLLGPWDATPRIAENPYGAMSPRERRAVADGLPIVRLRYRRAAEPHQ